MTFLLQEILLQPSAIKQLPPGDINQLVSQARSARLLATLALQLHDDGILDSLPQTIARHFRSGVIIHEKQKRDLQYDSAKIGKALAHCDERLVLLKGAAYILAELPVGRGRLITDIDIIVPRDRIDAIEAHLIQVGWEGSYVNSYNEQYYRKWGHEIPPLTNVKRGTTLDVHHNILPPTAGPNVDASLLFDNLIEIKPGIYTLSLQDMVIHSATHLFHEGEFHHGLRDLWDLDRMLRDFPTRDEQFWQELVARARELDLLGSLYHALNFSTQIFATPLPDGILRDAENRWQRLRKPIMDFLFFRAFRPDHPNCKLPYTGMALYLLYVRSHYLRMPLYLLLPHLARKAWMSYFDDPKKGLDEEDAPAS